MDKLEILEKVHNYNVGCGYNKGKFNLKAVHFKYALLDKIITDEEYNFYFKKL